MTELTRPLSTPRHRWALIDPEAMRIVARTDYTFDQTDDWREEVDPEGEVGATCEGLFFTRWEDGAKLADLIGLLDEDDDEAVVYDREGAMLFLGYDVVRRMEDRATERLNDGGV